MNRKQVPPLDANHVRAERLAESVWVRLFSRMSMISAPVALAMIGYFGSRTMVTVDEAVKTINETSTRVLVLQQQITDSGTVYAAQETQMKAQLQDHEARLRALERPPLRR